MNKKLLYTCIAAQMMLGTNSLAQSLGDPALIEARSILERISGVKVSPNHSLLAPMADKIRTGDRMAAAQIATTHPDFLNVTVKHMALGMSTREETIRLKLNDFAASFIGVTRDESDARELLNGNFYYRADMTKIPKGIDIRNSDSDITDSNNHYSDLDRPEIDAGSVLQKIPGQILGLNENKENPMAPISIANPDPAGVLTSRTFLMAHTVAGTNRRAVEFTFREFMCSPIENWADTKVPDTRIGRDIDRFPGGDHQKFLSNCKGCHTGMDGFRGAFAQWDVGNNRVGYGPLDNGGNFDNVDGNRIARKMNQNNNVFSDGFVTKTNGWINNARGPANNSLFGWRSTEVSGNGLRSFGNLLSNSKRFSQCMVKRVFEGVCRRNLSIENNLAFVDRLANGFEGSNYNLKKLFQTVVVEKNCIE